MIFYILYGRKSPRHKWNIQGYATDLNRVRLIEDAYHRDAFLSGWAETQTSIRQLTQEQFDNRPDNIRTLPGIPAKY